MRTRVSLFVVVATLAGCGGHSTPVTTAARACDPLALDTKPISLAQILGVGRDANGVLYVIDQTPQGSLRLFMSDGSTLKRQAVAGSGQGTQAGGTFVIVNANATGGALNVEIVTDTAGHKSMGLVRGMLPGKTFTIGQTGETLMVQDTGSVASLAVENLPGTIVVEHLATVNDGRTIVVTRPEVDWSYDDFRLFLGMPPTLEERHVSNVSRGSFTVITFELDGSSATARFGSSLSSTTSTLTVGAAEIPLTVPAENTLPTGLSFMCF